MRFGVGYPTIQRIVRRVASRARISWPVSPHVLRHTFSVTVIQRVRSRQRRASA